MSYIQILLYYSITYEFSGGRKSRRSGKGVRKRSGKRRSGKGKRNMSGKRRSGKGGLGLEEMNLLKFKKQNLMSVATKVAMQLKFSSQIHIY